MSILLKLKASKESMTNIERKIADFILSTNSSLGSMTTYEIAKKCKTSQASIVRFSKKMGYDGFLEFKMSVIQELAKTEKKK